MTTAISSRWSASSGSKPPDRRLDATARPSCSAKISPGPPPQENPAAARQLARGRRRYLVEVVYPGSIASGDLGLFLFSAAGQDLLNDLVAPGEGGLDMGII